MTESDPLDPAPEPGTDPSPDQGQDLDDRGPVDSSEREDRPGVTKDPDDPEDTDFENSPGLVE
jgi:hypothetical protein